MREKREKLDYFIKKCFLNETSGHIIERRMIQLLRQFYSIFGKYVKAILSTY